jgi:hypothetical protein
MLAGCAAHNTKAAPEPPAPEKSGYFIDLEPGWRLRVVTPILKSGGYELRTSSVETNGSTITASAADFIGFETAYYSVSKPHDSGIRIEFISATVTKAGETTPEPQALVPLFELPAGARFVRLIYLIRTSQADHNMAIVASDQKETLDSITSEVKADPSNCKTQSGVYCSWIPAGISVRPEF